jgi:ribonuclease inhibitor
MTKKAVKPKRAVIPASCKSIDAVYDILARELALPRHFGRNLDALYDALTGEVEGPFEIIVDPKALERALGGSALPLLKVFADAAKARGDMVFSRKRS